MGAQVQIMCTFEIQINVEVGKTVKALYVNALAVSIVAEMIKPHILNFGENYFFFFLLLVSQILYSGNSLTQS